ncbi:MAG: glycosyl transferase family 2, partial [Pseudomonas sp.]|nr:glycosyl transferase family 2 [Pseudomonas sp.]
MRTFPYVGRALAFRRDAFLALGGFDSTFTELAPHDMLWRMVEDQGTQVVGHLAEIALESSFDLSQWLSLPAVTQTNPRLLSAHLDRLGI